MSKAEGGLGVHNGNKILADIGQTHIGALDALMAYEIC